MKIITILFLLFSLNLSAQRVEFNDPDLTFSFEKPSDWKVQDGLTVYALPISEPSTNPTIFFSITYFEEPEQVEESDILLEAGETSPAIPSDLKEFRASDVGRIYIAEETALWASYYHTQDGVRVKAISYVFKKMNQRFEVSISAPKEEFAAHDLLFSNILSSIAIIGN